jgi:hypothetical protein
MPLIFPTDIYDICGASHTFKGGVGPLFKYYNFSSSFLPSDVVVVGASLASGFGSDGNIAWPAHNLISPTDGTNWGGWSGANGGTRTGTTVSLGTSAASSFGKSTQSGLATLNSGDKLIAKCKISSSTDAGKTVNIAAQNTTASTLALVTLPATPTENYVIRTCAETATSQRLFFMSSAADNPLSFQISNMQLARYPMSPERYVAGTDTSNPYAPSIAEMLDHFETTGVKRGLRVRSGVDTATIAVKAAGLYTVTYYWLDTDETTVLSQAVLQYGTTTLTLSPPVGEHILRVKISTPVEFSLTEFSIDGLVFGVSGGGEDGVGAASSIRLSGMAPNNSVIQAKITQGVSTIVDWHDIGTTTINGAFAFKTDPVPRGEGYTAQIRLKDFPSIVLTMTHTFHCRDLIIATGSSNCQNAFINDSGQAITDFITTFKLYNGNNPVTVTGVCQGGAKILGETSSATNTFFYIPGGYDDLSVISTWEDFENAVHGSTLYTLLNEIGGEITAMLDGSGANDLGWTSDSEEKRVYKLAQSRKFKYAEQLSGRSIPFIQQEIGILFSGTAYNDLVQNIMRQNHYDMLSEYANVVRGGVMWDQHTADGSHLEHYITLWQRHCKSIVTALGYTSSVVTRGPYVSSVTKTDSSHLEVNVTLRDGTTITPSSAHTGWGVRTSTGNWMTITSSSVGTPVDGIVPITLTLGSTISETVYLFHRYGNCLSALPITTSASIADLNAALDKLPRDDTGLLPIEWIPGAGIEISL